MYDDAELRRAADFLADLEKNLALSLNDTAPNPPVFIRSQQRAIQKSSGDSLCPSDRTPSHF
jgi:hypothetical protein